MKRMTTLMATLGLFSACSSLGKQPKGELNPAQQLLQGISERGGVVLGTDAYGDSAARLVYLDQGWGPPETLWFYHADQGSVLLPYDTLVHLEQATSPQLLIAPENLSRFRLLNQHKTPNNPDALPIGFARHEDKVGFTCAACHTAQINYRGTAMRIDGAPAAIDFSGFLHAIRDSLAATVADPAKLDRFAAALPKRPGSSPTAESAQKSLAETLAWFDSYLTANHSPTVEGFGRLDAIGRIVNQAIRLSSDPKNSIPPSAPASYPLLWDAPRHDYVQWTGIAANAGAGSLGRNTGEVIGVFAHLEVKHYETADAAKRGYPSSITANELVDMEESLRRLKSPRWPEEILPPIDRKLAAQGESLYQKNCVSCHALINRDDPKRKVVAMVTGISVVGTDDTSAQNLVGAKVPSGILAGAISPSGTIYGADMSALSLLADLSTRALAAQPVAAVRAIANAKLHGLEKSPKQGDHTPNSDSNKSAEILSYKARPLNGTWASSPYLHNGSVPTLYDLLLPTVARPTRFATGRLEFDPRKVGYVSDGEQPFVVDTTLRGNSNRGHEYGTALSEPDRWALVEYLKTL